MFVVCILLLRALEHCHKKAISAILFWICMHISHQFHQHLCTAISTATARQACTSSLHKSLFRINQHKHMHWNHEAHVSNEAQYISDHAGACDALPAHYHSGTGCIQTLLLVSRPSPTCKERRLAYSYQMLVTWQQWAASSGPARQGVPQFKPQLIRMAQDCFHHQLILDVVH